MSYSSDVKSELCGHSDARRCCDMAALNAAFCFFNTVNSKSVRFQTSSQAVALYFYTLFKELTGISFGLERKKDCCILSLSDENTIRRAAVGAGLVKNEKEQISCVLNGSLSVNECCRRSAIKGAFLASGYIADPAVAYHLEIVSHRLKPVNQIFDLLISLDIVPKIIKRSSNYVLYIKEKEQIADTLNLMGSSSMFFEYQEVILEKELKNELNRKQNFEQANLDKTLDASIRQCNVIKRLIDSGRFDTLDEPLKEIALLRIENPDLSLNELAALTGDKISRSGVNHRLKKLMEAGAKHE